MERTALQNVLEAAAKERGCSIFALDFDEDDNVIEVTIDKTGEPVNLGDCEFVHRAVLAAFDRNIEDYALTVTSKGIDGSEADALLAEMDTNNNQ